MIKYIDLEVLIIGIFVLIIAIQVVSHQNAAILDCYLNMAVKIIVIV